jgi:hypothetical protein
VQIGGLVAGTRYRATVTATTADGAAVSTPSNTLVAPKPKHVPAAKRTATAKHAKPAKTVRSPKPAKSDGTSTHGSKAKHGGKAGTTKHGSHRRG